MYRLMLASCGALLLGSAGAFFLFVPVLSIATVVLMLVGLTLMYGLGFQAGAEGTVRLRNPTVVVRSRRIGEFNG